MEGFPKIQEPPNKISTMRNYFKTSDVQLIVKNNYFILLKYK